MLLMLVPGILYLVIFQYAPLFGILIAFQDYSPFLGMFGSPWVGVEHFQKFVTDPYMLTLLGNTFLLAFYSLLFGFPVPILFALLLNEVSKMILKRTVQSLTFIPHFISSAVMVSIIYTFLSPQGGIVNDLIEWLGFEKINFMTDPGWFRPLYVLLGIWHGFGYGAIVYLAAITAIDPSLYESAELDGASRWQKVRYITIPGISNMIIIMMILQVGNFLSVDVDKILLMYNSSVYSTADVVQSYVYRLAFAPTGFPDYSYGAAVNLLQSIIALVLIFGTNQLAKKYSETRLF